MKTENKNPIRLVLADDHAVVRKGTRELLEEDPSIRLVAKVDGGVEVLELVEQKNGVSRFRYSNAVGERARCDAGGEKQLSRCSRSGPHGFRRRGVQVYRAKGGC